MPYEARYANNDTCIYSLRLTTTMCHPFLSGSMETIYKIWFYSTGKEGVRVIGVNTYYLFVC